MEKLGEMTESDSGDIRAFQCLMQRLRNAIDQFFNEMKLIPAENTDIIGILTEVQNLLEISSKNVNKEYANYVGSSREILDVLFRYQSWQFNGIFSTDGEFDFFYLLIISSLILYWTDNSHDFRSSLIDNGYLFYHVIQLKTLESIRFSEVAKKLATYLVAIVTNCAQELSFSSYISTIQWKTVLSQWADHPSKSIQFHSQLLCCFVASSFDPEELLIVDMNSDDLQTLLNMLGSASTSIKLMASGFGFTFSATEILQSLLHLFISQKNLLSVLSLDVMPTLLALLFNGHVQDKLLTCQLLWILLGEHRFQWDEELFCNPIKELLTATLDNEDESLQVLSKLLLSEPCMGSNDFKDELQGLDNFLQKTPDQWCLIYQSIGLSKYCYLIRSLSTLSVNKRVLFVILLQKVESPGKFLNLLSSNPIMSSQNDCQYTELSSDVKYPQCIWMKKSLHSCEVITKRFLKASAADKTNLFPFVCSFWRQISNISNVCTPTVLKAALDECASLDSSWHVLYELLSLLFEAEMSGLGTRKIQMCLLRIITILRDWSTVSKLLCSSLLNKGLILNHSHQLLNWTRKKHSTMVEYMVKANLRILLNCLHYSGFKVYVKAFDWLTLLEQLCNTAIPAIRLASKILGCYVTVQHLELSENDIHEMLEVTAKAAGSSYELNKFTFRALDVVVCLQEFVDQSKSDILPFIQASVLPVLNKVLSIGTLEEKIAITLLIWNILSLKNYDLSEDLTYSDLLQMFKVCGDDEELKSITMCILASCPENNHADLSTKDQPNYFDELIKTAYKYGRYTECVSWCLKKESSYPSDSGDLETKVIRAKALYHLYKSECSKIQFETSTKDDYYKASQRCYKKTKEVIGLLGMAYDKNNLDIEGCKMLVLSMMDYIHTTNKLNDCKRCYLCWRRLQAAASTNPGSSGSEGNKGDLKHSKLVHSHSIPYSLLDRFARSVPSKRNLKMFRSSAEGTQLKPHKGKIYAPKQITRDMFCTTCEDILSAKGETQFMRDFFDKIYDSSDHTKPRQSQKIEYGKWLYHFCAGLIYRNLIWEKDSFLNEDELYKLLLGCREYILSSEISSNSPEIYLMITPICGDEEDLKYGSVNNVLAGSLEWHIGRHKLDTKSLENEDAVLASFFLFHLGAINILVKFNPSEAYSIKNSYKVKAENSQIFFVPEETKRKEELPPGMWAHLLNEARFAEKESLEESASPSIDPAPLSLEGFELFGILKGVKKQLSEATAKGVQPSPGVCEKKFNFLPAGFEVRSEARPNAVSLPSNHSILVHHTFAYGTGRGETIFIVRDAIKDACYLIWNNFTPGLQYSVAFHFSPSEMLLTDVITDKQSSNSALQSPHFQNILDDAKKKLSSCLPRVLIKKGIFNFESLLLRIKGVKSFPSVDMKCSKETDCWYCSNCCDVCLKTLGLDSIKMQVNEMEVSVCNQRCAWYLPGKEIKTSVIMAKPGESPPPLYKDRSCPLFMSHKKYFHVYIEETADNLPVKIDVAVCFGNGSTQYPERKMYGVFFSRNIQKQMLFECFLSDSFNLLCPLPHNESNFLLSSIIKAYEDDGCIREYLLLAYDELKKQIGLNCRSDDTRESSPPCPDSLYAMASAIADDIPISDKKANDEICSKLHCWCRYFIALHSKDRDIVILRIFTTPDIVKTFLTFADSFFSEVGSNHPCLWALHQMFALWSSTSSLMSQLLIENGLMSGVLVELQALSSCPCSEDIMYLIQVGLSILCNLLQGSSNVAYFLNTVCDQIVSSFTTSMDPKIRILSTSVLSYLEPKLKLDYHLELKNEDANLMIDFVIDSISRYDIIFHPIPMLRSLHRIVNISESNARQFISHGLLTAISEVIETCDNTLQRELILILWTLASYSTFVEEIKSDVNLLSVVSSLKDKDDHLLSTASLCALWNINEESRDGTGFLAFAHGCYQFGMYERCITTCTKIMQLSSSDNDIQDMRLLNGKSLFHLCNKGIQKLPKTISPKDIKLKQVLNECIKYATEAVNLLGFAHDYGYIDEDGRRYLDLCMMFLISSGNSLNKCQRCLLCLSNLKSAKSKGESEKQHKGLQHSHVIPKAVLDAFSSGLITTTSQRIFRLCGTERSMSQLQSPKECTWFILCSKCEQLFGIFEEQFVNNFFKKIYDVSNPASPQEGQEIVYGRWLYQFCASLYFRGMAILDIPCNDNVKRFQNSVKLYEIFVSCRQILLSPSDAKIIPSIHVLINNTSPTSEDSQLYTTMHEVLVSPEVLGVAAEKDPKKYFVGTKRGNLFLAHMGIINVVFDVEATISSNRHLINQEGGLYHVPPDSERDQFIPPDVKEIFYTSAKQMEIQKETMPDKLRKSHWAKGIIGSPPSDHEQTFMVHPAQKKDFAAFREEGVRPSQDPSKVKVVSFLPLNFNIMQTTGLLELPPGHRILFHCEPEGCRNSFDKGITVFLAIGDGSKGYTTDKPYAIYHKYDPGLQFNMAMFISSEDLSATTLINSGSLQQTAEMLFKDSHFKENIRLTLNTALHQMGFASFNSFLPHAQDKRVHSKCLTKRRCWYCINRCDNCMDAAAVGLTMKMSGTTVKFCSKVCNQEFNTNPKVLNLLPASFRVTNNNGKIAAVPPVGHKMLQFVNDYYDEDEYEIAATHTTRVCVGDGSVDFMKDKVYIIYETVTVLSQTLVAFFISNEFSVIPLTSPPKVCDAEAVVWFSKRIQPSMRSAVEAIVSQAGFASFKEWCTAVIQGKIPFSEQY